MKALERLKIYVSVRTIVIWIEIVIRARLGFPLVINCKKYKLSIQKDNGHNLVLINVKRSGVSNRLEKIRVGPSLVSFTFIKELRVIIFCATKKIRIISELDLVSIMPKDLWIEVCAKSYEIDAVLRSLSLEHSGSSGINGAVDYSGEYKVEVYNGTCLIGTVNPDNIYWAADPFIHSFKDSLYLIVEYYDKRLKMGEIRYSYLGRKSEIKTHAFADRLKKGRLKFAPLIKEDSHLAYPSKSIAPTKRLTETDENWILVDNFKEKNLRRYCVKMSQCNRLYIHSVHDDNGANLIDPIIIQQCDSTMRVYGGKYLSREMGLVLSIDKRTGSVIEESRLPMDIRGVRNAGSWIRAKDGYSYRPAQITTPTYGSGAVICKFDSRMKFVEMFVLTNAHHIDLSEFPLVAMDRRI